MLIVAHHHIHDPEKFWSTAKSLTGGLPAGLKLHNVFPSADMKTSTCLWEAPSVNEVQKFLDDHVGNSSKNICYQVNEAASMGLLPNEAMVASNN